MTKLLVSVRDAAEAEDAVEAGAHLIDVKEPTAGSLGAAPVEVVQDVVRVVAGRRPVSAAFGELSEFDEAPGTAWPCAKAERPSVGVGGGAGRTAPNAVGVPALAGGGRLKAAFDPEAQTRRELQRVSGLPSLLEGLEFAKIGLAGCASRPTWATDWQRAATTLPKSAALVAVIYADWQRAEAPPPQEVIAVGRRLDCRAMLIDTFDKQGPGLLGLWSLAELQKTVAAARRADMLSVVGGQITERDLSALLPLVLDYIAVRGAVCSGSRTGRLDPDRVRQLVRAL